VAGHTPRYLSAHEADGWLCRSPFVVGGEKGIEDDILWFFLAREKERGENYSVRVFVINCPASLQSPHFTPVLSFHAIHFYTN
jgi:hypothetical protein